MAHVTLLPDKTVAVNNIFVIGKNFIADPAARAAQAQRPPVVSLKPTSAVICAGEPIRLPEFSEQVNFEIELLMLIGEGGRDIPEAQALGHVLGYGVGLDLTAHDLHERAKAEGLPWTLCKGFPTAAPLSAFVPAREVDAPEQVQFALQVNGVERQRGTPADMVFSLPRLVSYLSRAFTLHPGDVIYTGTPAGAGPLAVGDRLVLDYDGRLQAEFAVA